MREAEMEIEIERGSAPLAGTLALPDGEGPHPAALLLWAGRADREGDVRAGALGLGRAMAEGLAARGIASYRYDRCGHADARWRDLGFTEHRAAATAALTALGARPDIGPVGVVGHSDGALHAMGLAARPDVAAAVLLACPARSGKQVYLDSARHWTTADLPRRNRLWLRLRGRSAQDQVQRTVARAEADDPRLPRLLRDFVRYDPAAELVEVRAPVLALTGAKDLTVDPADLDRIAELVPGPVVARRVPDLTHLLRRDPGDPSREDYRRQLAEPVDPGLVAEVADWLCQQLAPAVA
ncbi:alpha/beta hydrolase [Actinokineospora sp. G85]|uniref:alpha/beta hydrolase n=1 Tax=Actinokineospora sp. G85 TaxID=3406626 RepID=UPI003C76F01C